MAGRMLVEAFIKKARNAQTSRAQSTCVSGPPDARNAHPGGATLSYVAYESVPERDGPTIARLWEENLPGLEDRETVKARVSWMYGAHLEAPARTWLLGTEADGGIVGCGTVVPCGLWIEGAPARGGLLCDFAIDSAHRAAGPALQLQRTLTRALFDDGFDVLIGHPNAAALPVFRRLGFATVADSTRFIKVLRGDARLSRSVGDRAGRFLAPALSRLLAVNDRRLLARASRSYRTRTSDSATDEFDRLWETSGRRFGVSREKTAGWLNWRFGAPTTAGTRYFCMDDRRTGELVAWIAYEVTGNLVSILDALWSDVDPVMDVVFLRFARRMRREGHDSIKVTFVGTPTIAERLKHLLFFEREKVRKFICLVEDGRSDAFRDAVTDSNSWALFTGDLDV